MRTERTDHAPGKPERARRWAPWLSPANEKARRLGPLEYTLLALIGLGIAITIAMAILDPSA